MSSIDVGDYFNISQVVSITFSRKKGEVNTFNLDTKYLALISLLHLFNLSRILLYLSTDLSPTTTRRSDFLPEIKPNFDVFVTQVVFLRAVLVDGTALLTHRSA